ncbi:hypothetical protein V1520DRAFT_340328 [Lipomyces starkeyi]|uniref:Uncharacterized protein n=1 Tax=Lipomyces starkeyi NRRL Y-11557 TaxID=675824 RepID=A0A1E3QC79_LIPST|nr:hypothetical protein LIPSTDRAFT_259038 [Lipomyces starkeyi NRRL Y-11557]
MASTTVREQQPPMLDSSRSKAFSRPSKTSSSGRAPNSHGASAITGSHPTEQTTLGTSTADTGNSSSLPKSMRRSESSSSLFSVFKSMSMGRRQRRDSSLSTRSTATAATVDIQSCRPGLSDDSRDTMYKQAEKSGSSMSLFATSLFVPKMRENRIRDQDQQPTKPNALERRRKLAAGFIRRAVTEQPQARRYPQDQGGPMALENAYKNGDSASIASITSTTSSRLRSISQKFTTSKRSSGFSTASATDVSLTQKVKVKASSSLLYSTSRSQKTYVENPSASEELVRALYSVDDSSQMSQNRNHSSIQRSYPQSSQQQSVYMLPGINNSALYTPNTASRKVSAGSSVSATSSGTTSEFTDDASSITTVNSSTSTSPALVSHSNNRKVSAVSNASSASLRPVGGVCWIGEHGTALRAGRAWDYFGEDTDEEGDGDFYSLKAAALSGSIRSRTSNSETSKRFSNDGAASLRSSGQDWRFEIEEESTVTVLAI